MPGLVKIGLTTKTPKTRAAELTAATGVPMPFKVEWARAVSDCAYVERAVHRMLDDKRVDGKMAAGARKEAEFFRVDVRTARQVIEAAAGAKLGMRWRSRSDRFRRPGRRGRRQRGQDSIPALMGLSTVLLLAVLIYFRPALPDWLPAPVLKAFVAVERLYG